MKVSNILLLAFLNACAIYAFLVHPQAERFARRNDPGLLTDRTTSVADLFKRKGGGGHGGGGGGGGGHSSGGSGSSGGSSGGRSGGSSSGGSSSGSSSGSRSGGSNAGGRSSGGSGVKPTYGGQFYPGGARVPYAAGQRSPNGLLAAGLIGFTALTFWPGHWLYGAYWYPYSAPYTFYNSSSGANETKPIECLCQQYAECGCEDNTDPAYLNSIVGNGSTSALNDTLVHVADVNGTSTILINGTLANGTTAAGSGAQSLIGIARGRLGWCVVFGSIAWSLWLL